jgi:ABC-type antimicrobial peptide transport system ATPase subunit
MREEETQSSEVNRNLVEPKWPTVQLLIEGLNSFGIEIREKRNLERLKG